ncbi:MAG: hypothetical protein AB7N91_15995 [Candidatus Tectimicrobiota bacterium]
MATERPWFSLQHLAEVLRQLWTEQRSGTLFCTTDANTAATIVLRQGDIVALSYRATNGMAALPQLLGQQQWRYNFKAELLLRTDNDLPGTAEILQRFPGTAPATLPPARTRLAIDFTTLLKIVREEANQAFGPVGAMLCAEYFTPAALPQNLTDIEQRLTALSEATGAHDRAASFRQRVLARLQTIGA